MKKWMTHNFIYRFLKKVYFYRIFIFDYVAFRKQHNNRFLMQWSDQYPQLYDRTGTTGFDRHYVYHTAWAARKVAEIKPEFHVDISSSLYFASLVSAFIPVKFYDYRPADLQLSGLFTERGDLMNLPFEDDSIKSLSCMHVIEHIGLGRYGDPINPEGDLKSIKELKRVLAKGGSLLFVVPIGGVARIQFNAHRIYTYEQIMGYFNNLQLKEFTLIPEMKGGPIVNATKVDVDKEQYGCGCFWFIK